VISNLSVVTSEYRQQFIHTYETLFALCPQEKSTSVITAGLYGVSLDASIALSPAPPQWRNLQSHPAQWQSAPCQHRTTASRTMQWQPNWLFPTRSKRKAPWAAPHRVGPHDSYPCSCRIHTP
jgi:hypothetical protein